MAPSTAVALSAPSALAQQDHPRGLTIADPSAVAAAEAARARIESAYTVAMRKPRDADEARLRIIAACKRPLFAERVEYAKPVGGKAIKGPSIRLAELELREWGNVLTETTVVFENDEVRRLNVRIIDLQTNASFGRDIQLKKTVERRDSKGRDVIRARMNSYGDTVYIVRATDDELMNAESAAVSKVVRNEGLRVIPSDITDEAMETARETLRNRDKGDPDAARKRVIDAFAGVGVRPQDLASYLGHPVAQIQPAELETLRALHRALADGETTWKEIVEAAKAKDGGNDEGAGASNGKSKADNLAEKIGGTKDAAEGESAEDIMLNAAEIGEQLEMKPQIIKAKIAAAKEQGVAGLKNLRESWAEMLQAKSRG